MFGIFNCKKKIDEAKAEIYVEWAESKRQEDLRKKECKEIELQLKLNTLVICVSNEIENITVGVATKIIHITKAMEPQLIVFDLVKKKEIMPFGVIFDYSEQKFDALNKLEANERIAIIYNRLGSHIVDKTATKVEDPEDSTVWKEKVKKAIKEWELSTKN